MNCLLSEWLGVRIPRPLCRSDHESWLGRGLGIILQVPQAEHPGLARGLHHRHGFRDGTSHLLQTRRWQRRHTGVHDQQWPHVFKVGRSNNLNERLVNFVRGGLNFAFRSISINTGLLLHHVLLLESRSYIVVHFYFKLHFYFLATWLFYPNSRIW